MAEGAAAAAPREEGGSILDGRRDPGTIARLRDALAGGYRNHGAERDAAAVIETVHPGTGKLLTAAWDFHARAAAAAVTGARGAGAVIFTSAGLPRPGDAPLHAAAAAASPCARFLYCDAAPKVTLMREALTVLPDPGRTAAAQAGEEDPGEVLDAAAAAGLDLGAPVSVHVLLAAQRWPARLAVSVLRAYRRRLAPGSSVCLSLLCTARTPAGDRLAVALAAAFGPQHGHGRGDIAGWFRAAGMRLMPPGVCDARAWGRPHLRAEVEALNPAARVLAAAGTVPC